MLWLAAFVAGALLPLQAIANSALGRVLGSPIWAAAVSGLVLTIVLLLAGSASAAFPKTAGISGLPWWSWTGGLFGGFILAASTALTPRLGAGATFSLVIAGQVACMMLVDHFGFLDLPVHAFTVRRAVAVVLLTSGVALTVK